MQIFIDCVILAEIIETSLIYTVYIERLIGNPQSEMNRGYGHSRTAEPVVLYSRAAESVVLYSRAAESVVLDSRAAEPVV